MTTMKNDHKMRPLTRENGLKAGDIVRVISQPPNQIVKLVGEVGWIEAIGQALELSEGDCINTDYVTIHTLRLDGILGGVGVVPLSCLQPEGGVEWIEAKRKADEYWEKMRADGQAYNDRFNAEIVEIAERHGLTAEKVREIHQEVSKL